MAGVREGAGHSHTGFLFQTNDQPNEDRPVFVACDDAGGCRLFTEQRRADGKNGC